MFRDEWLGWDYNMLTAFEEYYDKAQEELESMGLEGKMMLAALMRDKSLFRDLYKKADENAYICAYGDN